MAYPASSVALGTVLQDSQGAQPAESYTIASGAGLVYKLGANASPAITSSWQSIPKGAFPVAAPTAITAASTDTTAGGGLVAGQTYLFAMTNVTIYGETVAGPTFSYTVGASGTGVIVTLPSVTASTANPVRSRRLYRTKAGGTQLFFASEVTDLSVTTWLDRVPDTALATVPPAANNSGLTSPVTVTGGVGFTEVAPGTALVANQYTVDYGTSTTGGTITFAAADVGRVATITYTAATLVSAPFLQSIVTAVKDINTAFGTPGAANGTATLDGTGKVPTAQLPVVAFPVGASAMTSASDVTLTSTTLATLPSTAAITLTLPAGAKVFARAIGTCYIGNSGDSLRLSVAVSGTATATINLHQGTVSSTALGATTSPVVGENIYTATTAGSYTFTLQYATAGGSVTVRLNTAPNSDGLTFTVGQYA